MERDLLPFRKSHRVPPMPPAGDGRGCFVPLPRNKPLLSQRVTLDLCQLLSCTVLRCIREREPKSRPPISAPFCPRFHLPDTPPFHSHSIPTASLAALAEAVGFGGEAAATHAKWQLVAHCKRHQQPFYNSTTQVHPHEPLCALAQS